MVAQTVYADLRDAGIPLDSHESDLYVLSTAQAWAIIRAHGITTARSFVSQLDGKLWIDVPFRYQPWWDARTKGSTP